MRWMWINAVALLLITGNTFAQLEFDVLQLDSPEPAEGLTFGDILLTEDLNGDGFDDFVATEPWASYGGFNFAGRVWILFGPTFSESKLIVTKQPDDYSLMGFGSSGTPPLGDVGDVNADGHFDLLIPATAWNREKIFGISTGRVHLFFGPDYQDERVLYDPLIQKGELFGIGSLLTDLTGDGYDDVLVGAPTSAEDHLGELGRIWWWDGAELTAGVGEPHLLENPDPQSPSWFGNAIREGDMLGTEEKELLVSASDVLTCCPITKGTLYVLDRESLAVLLAVHAPILSQDKFGDVRYFGDLDGDGEGDLVVSAFSSTYETQFESNHLAGAIDILLGPQFTTVWKTLWSPTPLESQAFGAQSHVLDLDKDGDQDIVVGDTGSPFDDNARVRIFYGPDFSTMQSLGDFGSLIYTFFGDCVALADTDGDGFQDILVHSPMGNGKGRVTVHRVRTLTTPATSLSVSAGGDISLQLDLSADRAGHAYLGAMSLSGAAPGLVLGPGSYLQLQPDAATFMGLAFLTTPILEGFAGTLDAQGRATLSLHWPAGFAAGLAGSTLTVAVITSADGKQPGAGSSAVSIVLIP